MKVAFFDGVEARLMDGSSVAFSSLSREDAVLVVETGSRTYMEFNATDIEHEEIRLRDGGFCSVLFRSDVGAALFSMRQDFHDVLRADSKAKIVDASLSFATACHCQPVESLIVVNRYGDFVYLSAWIDGLPLETKWLIGTMIESELEDFGDVILQRMATTKLRIVSNLDTSFFDGWIEKLSSSLSEVSFVVETIDDNKMTESIMDVYRQAEYVTEDEYRGRMKRKERVRAVLSLMVIILISAPGVLAGGYEVYLKNKLDSELAEAKSSRMNLIGSLSKMNRERLGSKYYDKSMGFIRASEFVYREGFSKGFIYKSSDKMKFSASMRTSGKEVYGNEDIEILSSNYFLKDGKSYLSVTGSFKEGFR